MAELIRGAEGYVPGMGVVFLVPDLGQDIPGVPLPEHYVQQVADLLGAPAVGHARGQSE